VLDQIGYESGDLAAIRQAIHAPDGLVLVRRPSGSGRRTALYSMLEQVDPVRRDPDDRIRAFCGRFPAGCKLRAPDGRRRDGCRWERIFARSLRSGAHAILVEKVATPGKAQLVVRAAQAGIWCCRAWR